MIGIQRVKKFWTYVI